MKKQLPKSGWGRTKPGKVSRAHKAFILKCLSIWEKKKKTVLKTSSGLASQGQSPGPAKDGDSDKTLALLSWVPKWREGPLGELMASLSPGNRRLCTGIKVASDRKCPLWPDVCNAIYMYTCHLSIYVCVSVYIHYMCVYVCLHMHVCGYCVYMYVHMRTCVLYCLYTHTTCVHVCGYCI